MNLECRRKNTGIGYQNARWPKATHHIVHVGNREVRVIVMDGETPNWMGVAMMLVAGIFLS